MRRALPASLLTLLALGALAMFKSTPLLGHALKIAAAPPRASVSTTAPPRRPTVAPKVHATAPPTAPPAAAQQVAPTTPVTAPPAPVTQPPVTQAPAPVTQAPPPVTPATTSRSITVDGNPIDNNFGTVQVRVTIRGHQIVAIQALQMPYSHQTSADISQQAEPLLQQEALQAQSANIQILSGATYTSVSYAQSLQSALDKAHF